MKPFTYQSRQVEVHFGAGKIKELPALLQAWPRALVIGTERIAGQVQLLQDAGTSLYWFKDVVQHVPEALVAKALDVCKAEEASVLVAIGGGSAVGLAKAVARELRLPIVAVPTTYAGSEMTDIWGITGANGKVTGKDLAVQPRVVLYDPDLTLGMRPTLAASSAMNAMAHLMEGIYAPAGNVLTMHLAAQGMGILREGLEALASAGELTPEVNEKLLLGAFMGGKVLGEVPMALHHKAAHTLGGSFGLDHAGVHTVLQSHVLQFQWPYLGEAVRRMFVESLGSESPWLVLQDLARMNGLPTQLRAVGLAESQIAEAAAIMSKAPYPNPAPLTEEGLRLLFKAAY